MTKTEKLRDAQDLVSRELQRGGVGRIDAMTWRHSPQDPDAGIHQLTLFRNGEESAFFFSRHALLGDHGSRRRDRRLWRRVGKILSEFTHA